MEALQQDLQQNAIRQQEEAAMSSNTGGSAPLSPEIMEALGAGGSEPGAEPVQEYLPPMGADEPQPGQEPAQGGGGMSMEFLDPEMVVGILDSAIVFVSIIVFGKIYGGNINKKTVRAEMSFTAKEKNEIEKPLGKWLAQLQVKSPGPFWELIIVLLVILGSKSYYANENVKEQAELIQEEKDLKETERAIKAAAKIQKTAEKAGFQQAPAEPGKTKVFDMTPVMKKESRGRPKKNPVKEPLELPNDSDNASAGSFNLVED